MHVVHGDPIIAFRSERHTELETKVIKSLDTEIIVSVCRITVVCSKLETHIILMEWEICEADFR